MITSIWMITISKQLRMNMLKLSEMNTTVSLCVRLSDYWDYCLCQEFHCRILLPVSVRVFWCHSPLHFVWPSPFVSVTKIMSICHGPTDENVEHTQQWECTTAELQSCSRACFPCAVASLTDWYSQHSSEGFSTWLFSPLHIIDSTEAVACGVWFGDHGFTRDSACVSRSMYRAAVTEAA